MRCGKLLATTLILAASAPSLEAQRLVSLALGGGASFPQGDLRSGANIGWNALASLVMSTPMQPLGLRVDGAYSRFPLNAETKTLLGTANQSVGSATLNATYRIPTPGSPLSPYVIAGLGAYRIDCLVEPCSPRTRFGWNAGLGTRFYVIGFRSFLEARYHSASRGDEASVHYFPVTFGIIL